MKYLFRALCLSILFLGPLHGQAQITKAEFEAFQKNVNIRMDSLKMQLEIKSLALEKSQILYEKANQHISLTENVDSHFNNWLDTLLNILMFGLGLVTLFAGVLGYNALTFNKSLKQKIDELRAQAQQDVNIYTQQIKADLLQDFEAKFKVEREIILATFKKEEQLQNLQKDARVLVITMSSDQENQPYNHLKSIFAYTQKIFADELFNLPPIDFTNQDIVVIDNQHADEFHWDFNQEAVKNQLVKLIEGAKAANVAVSYYGDQSNDGGIGKHVAWNNPSNTFSNRLDTLVDAVNRALLKRQPW